MRQRLVALCVTAAIPITAMAATIVWQDYQSVNRGAEEQAAIIGGQVLAEIRSQIAMAGSEAVAKAAAFNTGACSATPRAAAIQVFGSNGQRRCDLSEPSASLAFLPNPLRHAVLVSLGGLGANGPFVVAVTAENGSIAAKVLAPMWLDAALITSQGGPHTAVWLLNDQHRIASSAGDVSDARPTRPMLAALFAARPLVLQGTSATNHRMAYAASDVLGGWRLIVAIDAEPEHQMALHVLLLRTAELGLLLLLGLAATVFAADVAFGAPLRRLSDDVHRWSAGEVFAPRDVRGAPDEVQRLAWSFAEATVELRDKEAALTRAQAQQKLLVLEVHHRVKNNLQIVASLLNLQASRIRVPEVQAEFQAARDRVRALATLHRHLYADGELHTINMSSFLTELCGQLFQAMGETEGERINLRIDALKLRISNDEAVPLSLIVTEIVTNSMKYAFPDGRPGTIRVSLTQFGQSLDLVISDDGVGIKAGSAVDRERDGIGLRLIRGFSRQLGATLDVEHGNGTRYSLRLSRRQLDQPVRSEVLDAAWPAGESADHDR